MPLPLAEIVPELVMPPPKVEIVTEATLVWNRPLTIAAPPTMMPLPLAEIVPELVMPPPNVEIVTDGVFVPAKAVSTKVAAPPTTIPFAAAVIAPELVMPPLKAEIATEAVFLEPALIMAVPPTTMPLPPAE
jgi:hypothetical protein